MNIILITAGHTRLPEQPIIQQLRLQAGSTEKALHANGVNLLVVDSRRMTPACLVAALKEPGVINHQIGFSFGLLLCRTATIKLTVAAMRAGLHDIVDGSISAWQLRGILSASMPRTKLTAANFSACASFMRALVGGAAMRQLPAVQLARRERELARRSDQLANIERRLAFDREALAARDQELSENTRRFHDQFSRFQMDVQELVAPPPEKPPTVTSAELETRAAQLEQRARDLDFREKLLTEMESLLSAQAGARIAGKR